MSAIDRRLALAGFGAAAATLLTGVLQAYGQTTGTQEMTLATGVRQIVYGENPSIIPGIKTVKLRDVVVQPGAKLDPSPMMPMICHMVQGELEVTRTNPNETFTAQQNRVWTCASGMTEGVANKGSTEAVMRIIDLTV
jgi:hypothetical protein